MKPIPLARLRDELVVDGQTLRRLAETLEHECKEGRHIDLDAMCGHTGLIRYIAGRLELAADDIARAEKVTP